MSCRFLPADPRGRGAAMAPGWWLHTALAERCRAIGALPQPICAPLDANAAALDAEACDWIAGIDALILGGGGDIVLGADGQTLGAAGLGSLPARDAFEYRLLHHARLRELPVLGICRGAQLIQVAMGGELIAPLADSSASAHHSNPDHYLTHGHPVHLLPDGLLASTMKLATAQVHSAHRWRIGCLAPGLQAEAVCPHDHSIEAFRADSGGWLLGLLWHPEFDLPGKDQLAGGAIFDLLRAQLRSRELHVIVN